MSEGQTVDYDNWKAAGMVSKEQREIEDRITDAENAIDRIVDAAIAKVFAQRIGIVEVQPCLVDVDQADAVDDESQIQLGAELSFRVGVPIGRKGDLAAGAFAEILEALADEIRRAAQ